MGPADLHLHLPMHLPVAPERSRRNRMDRRRAWTLARLGREVNHDRALGEPRVTPASLAESGVGLALSVLYSPFDEMNLSVGYRKAPSTRAFPRLLRQLERTEAAVAVQPGLELARDPDAIDSIARAGRTAVVHCLEGAVHLGRTPAAVRGAVAELADRGLAYVTVAHLFPRGVATVAPSLPRLSDRAYGVVFPQPRAGLSELGRAAVGAAVEHGVLVDVTHMSARSLADTFALLDALDPARRVPVIASHAAYRFGTLAYQLPAAVIARIAERDGVVGIIASDPHLRHGLSDAPAETFAAGAERFLAHVRAVMAITGSDRHVALGSDLGGFIEPLPGLANVRALPRLLAHLEDRLGPRAAEAIGAGNVLRVLRAASPGPRPGPWTGRGRAAPP